MTVEPEVAPAGDGRRYSRGRRVALSAAGLLGAGVIAFGVLAPPEHCPQPTAASIDRSASHAVQWFARNQNPDGTWLYEYDTDDNTDMGGYNLVRHAGAVMGLYQAANAGQPDALESADRGMAWVRDHLVEHDDWTTLADNGRAPTGGAALLASGLVERRLLTGDTSNDDLLRRLGRFMEAMTEPDGAVTAQYSTSRFEPEADSRSKYYTGEAYWALARLHRLFPDEHFGEPADRIGNYLATERDDVEDYWPPIPDHWVAYGLAETVQFPERDPAHPLTTAELAYARSQAGLFGGQVRWVSQQAGPWGRLIRGHHIVRGGGYGVVGEALTGLFRVAEADPRLADLRQPIADRAMCMAGLSQHRQTSEPGDPRADGAWFVRGVTRMDDQQHATSALLRTKLIVDSRSLNGAQDAPSALLWAVALIATFNPLFVGLALPRRETRKERATLAAAGGALGSVVIVAVALFSGPLLDAFDVSRAAARVAIGIVAAGAGLIRMFRRLPVAQPGPDDPSAAIVPVAIPYVATPALILLGLSAGADRGVAFVALALVVAVALLVAKAAWLHANGRAGQLVGWAARLLGAVAVATSVLLVIDGVLDV
jgi:small neutral amino acid transporter SnatA (MarC family)